MNKIILYGYPKCSTCRKAANWLNQNDLEYQFLDIVEEPPLSKYLDLALKQYSENIKKIFNTRGKNFKLLKANIYTLTKEEIIQLLQSDGKLIRRPFLVLGEKKIILGFNHNEYSNLLA